MDAGASAVRTPEWVPLPACGCCGAEGGQAVRSIGGFTVLRCERCGTLRGEAYRPPDSVYVEGYHLGIVDNVYDATTEQNRAYERHIAHRRLALLERHLPGKGRLVDAGGGVGNFVAAARERGWDGRVLEPVPDAVADAVARGIPAEVGGIESLRSDGDYDAIALLHVLEHLPEARASLEMVASALRPGGCVLIEVPNVSSAARRSTGDRWRGWWPGQHVYYFDARRLHGLLERAGLEVVEMRNVTLSWDGLILLHHAYIVGLEPALQAALRARAGLRRGRRAAPAVGRTDGMPPALRDERPAKRSLAPVLAALARVQERLGAGENLLAIARRRA